MHTNASTQDMNSGARRNGAKPHDYDRVRRLTFKVDLDRIDARTREAIRSSTDQGQEALTRRLAELDGEWPVDRAIMTGAGFFVWLGLILGSTVKRRLHVISAVAGVMILVYAFFGWAPPVMILRRRGFRTRGEIERERMALKALRGDFENLSGDQPDRESLVERAMRAAEI